MSGDVLVIASGKGGVGKTVTAVNLAVSLRLQDRSVALVDGDLAMPNVATHLGVDPEGTLHDVLSGEASLNRSVLRAAKGFGVLPGDGEIEGYAAADPARFAYVVDRLAHEYDCVLVDTGGGLSHDNALPLQVADDVLLVTSPDPPAVEDTARTRSLLDVLGTVPRGVVVTKVTADADPTSVAATLDTDLLAAVPDDVAVERSVVAGSPLEAHAPESDAAAVYRRLGRQLAKDGRSPRRDGVTA
ncbi:MAG: MinD/ParA family protein [Halobacteriaceae archaeon]